MSALGLGCKILARTPTVVSSVVGTSVRTFLPLIITLYINILLIILLFSYAWARHTRFRAASACKRLRSRVLLDARRYYGKHAYQIRRRELRNGIRGYCWLPVFPTVPEVVARAIGPFLTRRNYRILLRCYSSAHTKLVHRIAGVKDNHLTLGADDWGSFSYLGVNVQRGIDAAFSANAANLAQPATGQMFTQALKTAIKVDISLTQSQRAVVEKACSFPVVFPNTSTRVTDHAELAAMREIIRCAYDRSYGVQQTHLPTLAIGSGQAERKYFSNDNISHYYHCGEGKDYGRTISWMLQQIAEDLKKAASNHSRLRRKAGTSKTRLRFSSVADVIETLRSTGKHAMGLYTQFPEEKFEQLLFEDSIYNFSAKDLLDVFRRTGANIAYGYAFMPNELVFTGLPDNQLYKYDYNPITGKATVTFRHGAYANGYSHNRDAWATILRTNVINGDEFSLLIEIDARVGPMTMFKIQRVLPSLSGETVPRTISLPVHEQHMHYLDLFSSRKQDGTFDPVYKACYVSEFMEVVNYLLSLDPKSMTFENALAFVRRRGGGVSLINKELLAPWNLPVPDMPTFTLTCVLYVRKLGDVVSRASEFQEADYALANRVSARFYASLKKWTFLGLFFSNTLTKDTLVKFPESHKTTEKVLRYNPKKAQTNFHISVGETDVSAIDCYVCSKFVKKRGDQVLHCDHEGKDPRVTISMSLEELKDLRMQCVDTDNDPVGLRRVKEAAAAALPISAFEKQVDFHYILGGPGCGKSYLMRAIGTTQDGFVVPFTKLVPDYQDVETENGTVDLAAKTIHRAARDLRGKDILYIDEFTAVPFEWIKVLVYLTGASKVYIVGDTKQTKVQANEGLYIGDHITIDNLPRHVLKRNFRNPKDSVALLNRIYGYDMQAMSERETSIRIYDSTLAQTPEILGNEMGYSYATCDRHNLVQDGKHITVRTFQGSTVDVATLYIEQDDEALLNSDELSIVALSRHKQRLNIVHDGGAAALSWLGRHGFPISSYDDATGQVLDLPSNNQTPVHDQDAHVMSVDSEEIEEILVKHTPHTERRRKVLFTLTTTRLLFVAGILLKYLSGSFLVDHRITFGFWLFKTAWLNRAFFLVDNDWQTYPLAVAVSWIQATCIKTVARWAMLTLVTLTPELSVFFPLATGDRSLTWDAFFVERTARLAKFEGFSVRPEDVVASYRLLSAWYVYFVRQVCTLGGTFRADSVVARYILALVDDYLPVSAQYPRVFCDLFESWLVQVLHGLYLVWRYDKRDDVWYTAYMPDIILDTINPTMSVRDRATAYYNAATYYTPWLGVIRRALPALPERSIRVPDSISPKDAYLYARDCLPAWTLNSLSLSYPNALNCSSFAADLRTGTMQVADFLLPRNARGHIKATLKKGFSFGCTAGLRFTSTQMMQTLQVVSARYFNRKGRAAFGIESLEADKVLNEIVGLARDELLDTVDFSEEHLDLMADEFFKSGDAKHYQAQYKGVDNPNVRQIRFHLKAIFKPGISDQKPLNADKAGQGVSAWDKDAQIAFGLAAKWVNFVLIRSLKPNVIFDNRMSATQLRSKVRLQMERIDGVAANGVSDFEMFDAQQDAFSQELERRFLKALGVSDEWVAHYYSFRTGGKLIANGIAGRLETEKTSGEPLTLFGNSVISALLLNWLVRGDGPFVLVFKGDDGFKRQVNLQVAQERLDRLAAVCRLKIKLSVGDALEFCGQVIGPTCFAPSIVRTYVKVLGHEFRSYQHFCQYRESLHDFLRDVDSQDVNEIIAINAETFGETVAGVTAMLETVRSISHLGEEQFLSAVEQVNEVLTLPGTYDAGATYRVVARLIT